MDVTETMQSPPIPNDQQVHENEAESTEKFQQFIYELFQKNGILTDLRAYLRQHIVNVLKGAHTGDTPACQKHFAQRLDLTSQAINLLIAEYLLRLEFGYTLSVFVSEIPLANMVMDFSNDLLKGNNETDLRFKDRDVCSILNYLGIKCDSSHVHNILKMYKSDDRNPLLLCILKSLPLYQSDMQFTAPVLSSEDEPASDHSEGILSDQSTKNHGQTNKCYHYTVCPMCRSKIARAQKRSGRKEKMYLKRETSVTSDSVKTMLQNINGVESGIIDEMFEQLKSVYEMEIQVVRSEEEKRVKRALANTAQQLHTQKQEMETAFKEREEELELALRAKKKFLWGLARSLREQHDRMSRAMRAIKYHAQRLKGKEENLKTQLNIEQILKRRDQEMHSLFSTELMLIEGHLEPGWRERDALPLDPAKKKQDGDISPLRPPRQHLPQLHHNYSNVRETPSEAAYSSCDLLKELSILKKYADASRLEPRCLVDRSTLTDDSAVGLKTPELLNNEQGVKGIREDDRVKNNQLINDLKKQKNVNFRDQTDESGPERNGPTPAAESDVLVQMRQENERLRECIRQQEQQMQQLSRRAELWQWPGPAARARTAPAASSRGPPRHSGQRSPSAGSIGCHNGAGEELNLFENATTRVFVPGDSVPFIGLLRGHAESRRLMNQWRARRASPGTRPRRPSPGPGHHAAATSSRVAAAAATTQPGPDARIYTPRNNVAESINHPVPSTLQNENRSAMDADILILEPGERERGATTSKGPAGVLLKASRAKSPKSVLREAKEKLKTNTNSKLFGASPSCRDKSPASVLREAKRRLRKLEIEAEAVEKSYKDYRKRQTEMRNDRIGEILKISAREEAVVTKDVEDTNLKPTRFPKLEPPYTAEPLKSRATMESSMEADFDKYLREYNTKYNNKQHFNRNITTAQINPVPETFSLKNHGITNSNYLETPLVEFRKFYRPLEPSSPPTPIHSESFPYTNQKCVGQISRISLSPEISIKTEKSENVHESEGIDLKAKNEALKKEKNSKKLELEILKQNINKMYNMTKDTTPPTRQEENMEDELDNSITDTSNVLRIEVENNNSVMIPSLAVQDNLLVIVQSSVEAVITPPRQSDDESDKILANMTILINPKLSDTVENEYRAKTPEHRRSVSPEQAARLTRNDVLEAIFHADPMKTSSDLGDVIKDDSGSSAGKGGDDDFSADVDNYNHSRTDSSPISLPISPADETYWEDR